MKLFIAALPVKEEDNKKGEREERLVDHAFDVYGMRNHLNLSLYLPSGEHTYDKYHP
jgi:hypothetical protein